MTKTLRVNKSALFERLGYEPHPGQIALHRSTARYRVLACGARWGKSTAASMEAIAALLQPCDRSLGWVVAPTLDLTLRIVDQVRRTVHTYLPHRIEADDARQQTLVLRNLGGGLSTLNAKTADNPISLLGEGLDFVIVDEAAKLRDTIWPNYLSARLLDREGWALLLSTPNGMNWFHGVFVRGQKRRDQAYESWCSPSWENPYLDPQAIEAERSRMHSDAFAEQYAASFIGEVERCERCTPEKPRLSRNLVVATDADLQRCPECGDWVDAEGTTRLFRGRDGTKTLSIIDIRDNDEDHAVAEVQAPLPP